MIQSSVSRPHHKSYEKYKQGFEEKIFQHWSQEITIYCCLRHGDFIWTADDVLNIWCFISSMRFLKIYLPPKLCSEPHVVLLCLVSTSLCCFLGWRNGFIKERYWCQSTNLISHAVQRKVQNTFPLIQISCPQSKSIILYHDSLYSIHINIENCKNWFFGVPFISYTKPIPVALQ